MWSNRDACAEFHCVSDANSSFYCLSEDLDAVARQRHAVLTSNGAQGLSKEWEGERADYVAGVNKAGPRLRRFIDLRSIARRAEHDKVMIPRRKEIYARLASLGWENIHFNSFTDKNQQRWQSLVEVAEPLTSEIWTYIFPELASILEESQARFYALEKSRRLHQRCQTIHQEAHQFDRDNHPYRSILDALNLPLPSGVGRTKAMAPLHTPFPKNQEFLQWDFVRSMYEEENSVERVQGLFILQRKRFADKLSQWRDDIQNRLLTAYGIQLEGEDEVRPILEIRGSTEVTRNLSKSTRFLLRADTIFAKKEDFKSGDDGNLWAHTPVYFPDMVSSYYDSFFIPPGDSLSPDTYNPKPEDYVWYYAFERMVKALLKAIGKPDIAYFELVSSGEVFRCGRCTGSKTNFSWGSLVYHYEDFLNSLPDSDLEDYYYPFKTRHPVVFRHAHELDGPKRLAFVASAPGDIEQAIETALFYCLICCGVKGVPIEGSLDEMRDHMHEYHEIQDPTEGLCYAAKGATKHSLVSREQWEKDWDAYHDAKLAEEC